MIADQLLARFTISPPKDSVDFMRKLASADALCRTSLEGPLIVTTFNDGSILVVHEDESFSVRHPPIGHINGGQND